MCWGWHSYGIVSNPDVQLAKRRGQLDTLNLGLRIQSCLQKAFLCARRALIGQKEAAESGEWKPILDGVKSAQPWDTALASEEKFYTQVLFFFSLKESD